MVRKGQHRRNPLRAGHPVHGWVCPDAKVHPTRVAIPFERGIRFTGDEPGARLYGLRGVAIPFERGIRFTGPTFSECAGACAHVAIPFERGIRFTD